MDNHFARRMCGHEIYAFQDIFVVLTSITLSHNRRFKAQKQIFQGQLHDLYMTSTTRSWTFNHI